jgi:hypothetical protein
MKLLRNPVVVSLLALVAVLLVLYQFFGEKLLRGRRPAAKPPAAAAAKTASVAPAKAAPPRAKAAAKQGGKSAESASSPNGTDAGLEAGLLPEVDTTFVVARFQSWVNAPLRDPFMLLTPAVEDPAFFAGETNSPVPTWTLNAIWNQTDSRLAVIDDKVCRVGDVIEGYELIRIENDEVWFQGPWRNERLGFGEPKKAEPPGKAKRPAGKTQPKAKTTTGKKT